MLNFFSITLNFKDFFLNIKLKIREKTYSESITFTFLFQANNLLVFDEFFASDFITVQSVQASKVLEPLSL